MTPPAQPHADLLPCPFCGGSRIALASSARTPADNFPVWTVNCQNCRKGDLASYGQKANAIAAWNHRQTPPAAPADAKPFLYCVADNEGRPILDDICCGEHPSELEECFQDRIDNLTAKIVPVYTGPQIESLRERVERLEGALRDVREYADNGSLDKPLCLRDRITLGDGKRAHEDLDEILDVIDAAIRQPEEAEDA